MSIPLKHVSKIGSSLSNCCFFLTMIHRPQWQGSKDYTPSWLFFSCFNRTHPPTASRHNRAGHLFWEAPLWKPISRGIFPACTPHLFTTPAPLTSEVFHSMLSPFGYKHGTQGFVYRPAVGYLSYQAIPVELVSCCSLFFPYFWKQFYSKEVAGAVFPVLYRSL